MGSKVLTALESAFARLDDLDNAERQQSPPTRTPSTPGTVQPATLAKVLGVRLSPEESELYWASVSEIDRLNRELAKFSHGQAKARTKGASMGVGESIDLERIDQIRDPQTARIEDKLRRRAIKQVIATVEAAASKALRPVGERLRDAHDKLVESIEKAEATAAEMLGLVWIRSATAVALRESASAIHANAARGLCPIEHIRLFVTRANLGDPKPAKVEKPTKA